MMKHNLLKEGILHNKLTSSMLICLMLISLFSCDKPPPLSWHSAFQEKGLLQSTLFDRNLYQNLLVVDDKIYLYDPFVSNNIFVMKNQEDQGTYNKHLLKGSLFEDSPLYLPCSITNDLSGNLYILDDHIENRGSLGSPIIRPYDYKGEHLIYRYDLSEHKLQLLHRIAYDNTSDSFLQLFWWNDNLMLLSRSWERGYFLSSVSLDPSDHILKQIHRFENDILDIDVSGNILLTLESGGVATEYTYDGSQLRIKNQISLPSKDFSYSDNSYKILFTNHNSHYLVYKTMRTSEEQIMIDAFFVMQGSKLLFDMHQVPSNLIAFSKTRQTALNQTESIFALENRSGKIYFLDNILPSDV